MAEVIITLGMCLAKGLAVCVMLAGCVAIYLVESHKLKEEA